MSTAGDTARQWHKVCTVESGVQLSGSNCAQSRVGNCRILMDQNFWAKEMKQRIGRDNLAASVALCRNWGRGGKRGSEKVNKYKWELKLWTEKFRREWNNKQNHFHKICHTPHAQFQYARQVESTYNSAQYPNR
jgi:predicted DNA-binding WGR domain protein